VVSVVEVLIVFPYSVLVARSGYTGNVVLCKLNIEALPFTFNCDMTSTALYKVIKTFVLGHRGIPAPVRTHWIGLDWIVEVV